MQEGDGDELLWADAPHLTESMKEAQGHRKLSL